MTGGRVKVVRVNPIPSSGPGDTMRVKRLTERLQRFVGLSGLVVRSVGNDLRIAFDTGGDAVFQRSEVARA